MVCMCSRHTPCAVAESDCGHVFRWMLLPCCNYGTRSVPTTLLRHKMLRYADLADGAAVALIGAQDDLHSAQRLVIGRRRLVLADVVDAKSRIRRTLQIRIRISADVIHTICALVDRVIDNLPFVSVVPQLVLVDPIVLVVKGPRIVDRVACRQVTRILWLGWAQVWATIQVDVAKWSGLKEPRCCRRTEQWSINGRWQRR